MNSVRRNCKRGKKNRQYETIKLKVEFQIKNAKYCEPTVRYKEGMET